MLLNRFLANATNYDETQTHLVLVLLCIAAVVVVAVLVGVIFVLARKVGHRHTEQLSAVTVVWGLITVGSAIYAAITRLNWQKSHQEEMLTGYGDPHEVAPQLPLALWVGMTAAYLLLIAWAILDRHSSPRVKQQSNLQ